MQDFIYQIVDPNKKHVNPKAFALVVLSNAIRSIYSMELSQLNPSLCDTTLTTIELFLERFEKADVKSKLTDMAELLTTKVKAADERVNGDKSSTLFLYETVPDIVRQKPTALSRIIAFMYEVVNSLVDSITVVTDEHSELNGQFSHLSVVEFDYDGIVWRYELPNLGAGYNEGSVTDNLVRIVDGIKSPAFKGDSLDIDILFSLISSAISAKLTYNYFADVAKADENTVVRAQSLAKIAGGDWCEYLPTAHDYPNVFDLFAENYPNASQYEIGVSALNHLTTLDANDIDKVLEGFATV